MPSDPHDGWTPQPQKQEQPYPLGADPTMQGVVEPQTEAGKRLAAEYPGVAYWPQEGDRPLVVLIEEQAAEQMRLRAIEAERERDLAIAHDSQPYPTAWAYEQACAAREKWQARAIEAETRLAEARAALADANQIVSMTREHLRRDHPDCAYEALGVLNDAARAALSSEQEPR